MDGSDKLMPVSNVVHLTSPANPRVKTVLQLREQRGRRRSGLFIAEGEREVSRALEAGLTLRQLFWCPPMTGDAAPRCLDRAEATPHERFTVTPAIMTKIAYRQNPEGVLAVFEQPRWQLEDLAEVVSQKTGLDELWLVAAGTQKPGNLGSMVRSAEAAGCSGVLACDAVVDAFNPNAIRASTGAVFELPVVGGEAEAVLGFLQGRGVRLIAATPDAPVVYTDVDMSGPLAVVVGAEDTGLDRSWLDAAGQSGGVVRVPMLGRLVDSLNASVAAAVLLFEAVRQRGQSKR